jgi:hypothetical protein
MRRSFSARLPMQQRQQRPSHQKNTASLLFSSLSVFCFVKETNNIGNHSNLGGFCEINSGTSNFDLARIQR